jgi:UDP-N-acetyl-D-mannosaminuronate dehydrogenase
VNRVKEAVDYGMKFTGDINELKGCNIYIVTVPSLLIKNKHPALTSLIKARETIGKTLKKTILLFTNPQFSWGNRRRLRASTRKRIWAYI